MDTYESIKKGYLQKQAAESVKSVDADYVNSFLADAKNFVNAQNAALSGANWASSTDAAANTARSDTLFDLTTRADMVGKYLDVNKSNMKEEDYNTFRSAVDTYKNNFNYIDYAGKENEKYYSQFATQQDYDKYLDDRKAAEEKRKLLEQLDQVNAEYDPKWYAWNNAVNNGGIVGASQSQNERAIAEFENLQQTRKDLLAQVTEKDRYDWEGLKMSQNAAKDKNFQSYAAKGAAAENPKMSDVISGTVNAGWLGSSAKPVNKVTYTRNNWDTYQKFSLENASNNPVYANLDAGAYGLYDLAMYMTEDEVNTYNYYLGKDLENGTNQADQYLKYLEEELNGRKGTAIGQKLSVSPMYQLGYAAVAGLDQFVQGVKNVGSMFSWDEKGNYVPTSSAQVTGAIAREGLKDVSIPYYNWKTGQQENIMLGENSIGQAAYDAIQSGVNMLPSIVVSTAVGVLNPAAGAAVGGALLGASAAGNAYQEKIQAGWTQSEARSYGLMVGASEAALETALGAVGSAVGGGLKGLLGKVNFKAAEKIGKVIEKAAKTAGGKIALDALGEGVEEGIQSILEPYFARVVAGEEFTFDMEETLYSALLGAFMGAGFGAANPNTYQGNIQKTAANDGTVPKAETPEVTAPSVNATVPDGIATPTVAATPSQQTDALANVEDLLLAAKPDPVADATKAFKESGIVSNAKAEAILASPEALQQLTEQTGIPIEGTKSQQRAAVKEAVAKIDEPPVDNTAAATYDNTINQGGIYNGQRLQQNDGAGSLGNSAEGMAGVQPANRAEFEGRKQSGGVAVGSGVLRVSQELQSAQASRGTPTYPIYDTTAKPDSYAAALEAGRASDVKNGWCVTPKTAQDLQSENVRTVMNADGTVGAGIAPNGDIVAVFKNKNGGPAKALHTLMPAVIEQGGDRLDCYGEGLVGVYAQYGFIPVARVEFNPEYANDGWTPDKGTPYIYFMAHNGDSAAVVAEKIGAYTEITKQKLDSLPTFGKEAYDEAMAYRDNYMDRKKASAPSPNESVGAAPAGFGAETYEEAQSKVIKNSYANATDESMRRSGEEALKNDPDIGTYYRSKEATSVRNAESRTQTREQVEYEYQYLMENGINSAEDLDTSMRVREALFEAGDTRFQDMVRLQRQTGTKSGQITQAFAKYSRMSADSVAAEVVDSLDQLNENNVPKKFWKKDGFDKFKEKTLSSAMDIAKQINAVKDGDVNSMKDIIRSLAKFRKTTAWFGTSSKLTKTAEAAMNSLTFEEAKAIANAQLSTLPNDFKKRPIGQVVKTFRIHNMLSALTTINRNLTGNATIGFVDAVSDSTVGRFFDHLVSKATGKRTVGNDVKYAKTYFTKAWDATKMAALCAELDVPMEDETKYSVGRIRTYSPQGNPVMRFFSAYEKYMKYALEVTDQFFAGGTNATVDESLASLGDNTNLSESERKAVSELAGQRRTFKDERTATRFAKGLRKGLNHIGTENIGLGDITMPFASIGSTMAHTATDYTAGAITGTVEILKLISDVKHGKYVDVDGVKTKTVRGKNGETRQITLAEAQRSAVTNAARGVTGIPLIATFAGLAIAGVLKVHDDNDPEKRALDQSQGLSGAQLNVDAALRWLTGGSTEWRDGDAVISLDFLEPFNAQMYLGWLIAQEDSVTETFTNYPKNALVSVVKSIADMPAMQGMQEVMDILSGLTSIDKDTDLGDWATGAAGTFLGSTASGFIPSWMRQTAQVIDPYYRDTTGENALDSAWNQFAAAVPFLSQSLPKKYSGLGQEQRRYDDLASGIFNTFINPGDADRLNLSDVASYLDALFERTGDESIYPSYRAPGSVGSGDDKIVINGKDMTESYQKTYGENVNRIYEDLIASSDFDAMDDASKTKALNDAKAYASATAKTEVGANASIPKYISERPSGMSEAEAIVLHSVKNYIDQAIGSLVDNFNVDVDPGAVDAKLDEAYAVFGNMSDAVKNAMLEEGGRVKYFLSAKSAGVSTDAFGDIYQRFYGISNETSKASVKAQQFASYLEKLEAGGAITEEQKAVIKNTMKFYNMSPADTVVYDRFVESGVESENADYIIELFGGLTPEEGYTSVRPVQKYEAIAGAKGFTEEEKIAAMKAQITDEKLEAKFDTAIDHGYDTEDFANAYRANSENKKKADFRNSMIEMGYTAAQAMWFYDLYHGK